MSCAFCGRRHGASEYEHRPGYGVVSIWRGRPGNLREFGICAYCARSALRALGEVPDASDGVIDLASHRRSPAQAFGG